MGFIFVVVFFVFVVYIVVLFIVKYGLINSIICKYLGYFLNILIYKFFCGK